VDFAKKTSGLGEIVKKITQDLNDKPFAKMQALFDYVKQNITWNGELSHLATAKKPENILQSRKGNAADLNLLLVALCKEAALKSYPTVLATKETGKASPDAPILNRLNYAVAAVEIDNKTYLLDATSPNHTPDFLPLNCLNGKALVIGNAPQTIDLKPTTENTKNMALDLQVLPTGELSGTMNGEESGYIAHRSREIAKNNNIELCIQKSLQLEGKGINILSYQVLNDTLPYQNLQIKASIQATANAANTVATTKEISWLPLFVLGESINPFADTQRKYPVDFVFPFTENFTLVYHIPANYQLKTLPSNSTFGTEDKSLSYIFEILQSNGTLKVLHQLKVNQSKVEPAKYEDLRNFWEKIVQKHKEKIVLERK
jgi:hypothetical protein